MNLVTLLNLVWLCKSLDNRCQSHSCIHRGVTARGPSLCGRLVTVVDTRTTATVMDTQTPSSPSPSRRHHREGRSSGGFFRLVRRGTCNVQTQERKKNWKIMLSKIITDTSHGTSRSVRPLWPQPTALALQVWMAVWLPSTWMAACDVTTSVPMNTQVSHEHLTTNKKCILSSGVKLLLNNLLGD